MLRRVFLKVHQLQLAELFWGPTPVASTLPAPRVEQAGTRAGGRGGGSAGAAGGGANGAATGATTVGEATEPGYLPLQLSVAQAGFTPGRQGLLQAALLLQIIAVHKALLKRKQLRCGAEPPVLVALLLDLEKCFDLIDHEQLLDVAQHTIGLPRDWLEIMRRILINNTTTVFGEEVVFGRGCPQGGACSPTYCLFMLEDLIAHLREWLDSLSEAEVRQLSLLFWVELFPERVMRERALVLLLLLFADDVAMLGLSVATVLRFLVVVGQWATKRKLRWSPKSIAAVVAGFADHDARTPQAPLPVQGVEVSWTAEAFKHLGVPVVPYVGQRTDRPFQLNVKALAAATAELRATHQPVEGRSVIHAPLLRQDVREAMYDTFLYPAAVVDVAYKQLDTYVLMLLRSLLGLPPGTPNVLLYSELRLLPSHLEGEKRALRMAAAFVAGEWWFGDLMEPLLKVTSAAGGANRARKTWVGCGPVRRWQKLLVRYMPQLFPGRQPPRDEEWRVWHWLRERVGRRDRSAEAQAATARALAAWGREVDRVIEGAYNAWAETHLNRRDYPAALRDHVRSVLCMRVPKALPTYLSAVPFLGAVGLRWKLPTLGIYNRQAGCPACRLCGSAHGECSQHLLVCDRLCGPQGSMREAVARLRQGVKEESGLTSDVAITGSILRLSWPSETAPVLTQALRVAWNLIATYRRLALEAGHADVKDKIWPLRLYVPEAG
jgi:hypothetical protein